MSHTFPETTVHPAAVVDPAARLGARVEVGPYVVVEAGASIGAGCKLEPHVHVHSGVEIGAGTSIGTGSAIGGEPQDTKYRGEATRVRIGQDCSIHEHVTVHRATGVGCETVVGGGSILMAGSHVGHNARLGEGVVLVNGAMVGGHVRIGERAFLSGNSAVHQFRRVGRLTLVGGGCMVTRDATPFSIVAGAYPVCWRGPNLTGLRRAGLDVERRTALRRALSLLFRSGRSPMQVAAELAADPIPEVAELGRFVLEAEPGVCGSPRDGVGRPLRGWPAF